MRGPNPSATTKARSLRQSDNDAEWKFWLEVRNRRLSGHKFVRQEPIGPYFVDFACRSLKLVIELDGSQHGGSSRDARRTAFLNTQGWSVARFWSHDVLADRDALLETVLAIGDGRIADPVRSYDFSFYPAEHTT